MRVISPDWSGIRERLSGWARRLVRERHEVLGVLLFGSLARGEHVPGSDADLLVVVRESDLPPADRPAALPAPALGIPADLVVYTEEELGRLLAERLPFLRRALAEGRWLATAPGWHPPEPAM